MVRAANLSLPDQVVADVLGRGDWLRVHGPAQARAARAAWPVEAGALPLLSPPGAAETLGPGWPAAMRAEVGARTLAEASDSPAVLAFECGEAVGLALAVLADWGGPADDGVRLVLALADSTPQQARAAVAARAGMLGVETVDAGALRGLDPGPSAAPGRVAVLARRLALARLA